MITEQKLFDLSFLEQMDDNNFTIEVIVLYIKDTHIDLEIMKQSFDEGDQESVYKTAHKLKSSTGMLQANTLFSILEKIEITAKSGEGISRLDQLVQEARYEFDQLKAALELHLKEIDN